MFLQKLSIVSQVTSFSKFTYCTWSVTSEYLCVKNKRALSAWRESVLLAKFNGVHQKQYVNNIRHNNNTIEINGNNFSMSAETCRLVWSSRHSGDSPSLCGELSGGEIA